MTNADARPPFRSDRDAWSLPDEITYLNHGSFGPSPKTVQQAREKWSRRLESQPMDFFIRRMEEALDAAARRLGELIGTDGKNLAFVENATHGMNVVAANIPLEPGDEVLLTDHEYGAVQRIWRERCRRTGARLVVRRLPPFGRAEEVVDSFLQGVTSTTRLIVVSHIASPTAVVLPVERICRRARERNVPVCIDGPHALAMRPLDLGRLDCDFYTASCHKWLCAPFGSGFLYVAPRRQQGLKPALMSWGRSLGGRPASWKDEFTWPGTRDPAPYLALPAAIEFLESVGWETFRRRTHELARYAKDRVTELTGLPPLVPDDLQWYGSMISLPLSSGRETPTQPNRPDPLQVALWERRRIEVPVMRWHGRRLLRVSCHLYNDETDIDRLVAALRQLW